MIEAARRIADHPHFQHFILGVIVVGAIVIGVETSATLTARYGAVIVALEILIQTIFIAEIAYSGPRVLAAPCRVLPERLERVRLRRGERVLAAAGRRLRDGRPSGAPDAGHATGLAFPELRLIIGTMVRSIPSMGHVIVLLTLLLYVYAVLGFHFFRETDAAHWGTLAWHC